MSKSALDQYTRSAAIDLIQHGVRVNSVSPGDIRTGIYETMGMNKESVENVGVLSWKTFIIFSKFRSTNLWSPEKNVVQLELLLNL